MDKNNLYFCSTNHYLRHKMKTAGETSPHINEPIFKQSDFI